MSKPLPAVSAATQQFPVKNFVKTQLHKSRESYWIKRKRKNISTTIMCTQIILKYTNKKLKRYLVI